LSTLFCLNFLLFPSTHRITSIRSFSVGGGQLRCLPTYRCVPFRYPKRAQAATAVRTAVASALAGGGTNTSYPNAGRWPPSPLAFEAGAPSLASTSQAGGQAAVWLCWVARR
jgi:hypothetical protein